MRRATWIPAKNHNSLTLDCGLTPLNQIFRPENNELLYSFPRKGSLGNTSVVTGTLMQSKDQDARARMRGYSTLHEFGNQFGTTKTRHFSSKLLKYDDFH